MIDFERTKEKALLWLVWHAPRELVKWAYVRVGAHATTGRYSDTIVPELMMMDALQRWDDSGNPIGTESGPELLTYMGTDAMLWAEKFCEIAQEKGVDLGDDPEGWMVAWFANAICVGEDTATRRKEEEIAEALREPLRTARFFEELALSD